MQMEEDSNIIGVVIVLAVTLAVHIFFRKYFGFNPDEDVITRRLREESEKAVIKEWADRTAELWKKQRQQKETAQVKESQEPKNPTTTFAVAPGPSERGSEATCKKLQVKNDELRQRLYAVLEKTEDVSKRLLDDRRFVVAELEKLGRNQFKNVEDDDAFYTFVTDTIRAASSGSELRRRNKPLNQSFQEAIISEFEFHS